MKEDANLVIEKPEGKRKHWKDHLTKEREEDIPGSLLICLLNIGIWMDRVYMEGFSSMQAGEAFSSKQSETSLLVRN